MGSIDAIRSCRVLWLRPILPLLKQVLLPFLNRPSLSRPRFVGPCDPGNPSLAPPLFRRADSQGRMDREARWQIEVNLRLSLGTALRRGEWLRMHRALRRQRALRRRRALRGQRASRRQRALRGRWALRRHRALRGLRALRRHRALRGLRALRGHRALRRQRALRGRGALRRQRALRRHRALRGLRAFAQAANLVKNHQPDVRGRGWRHCLKAFGFWTSPMSWRGRFAAFSSPCSAPT